jgi:hypothetical protein
VRVELASRAALDQLAQRLGISQGASLGVVYGRALRESGVPLEGLAVRLSGQSEGPIYFNEKGQPDRDLRATSRDGRFLFLNVQPGPANLDSELRGEAIVPVPLFCKETSFRLMARSPEECFRR